MTTPHTFEVEKMREFDERFPNGISGEVMCKEHGGVAVTSEIKSFLLSAMQGARKDERERIREIISKYSNAKETTTTKFWEALKAKE